MCCVDCSTYNGLLGASSWKNEREELVSSSAIIRPIIKPDKTIANLLSSKFTFGLTVQSIPRRFLPLVAGTCCWCSLRYTMWSELCLSMSRPPSSRERGHSSCFGSEAFGMAAELPRGEGSEKCRKGETGVELNVSKYKYLRKASQ